MKKNQNKARKTNLIEKTAKTTKKKNKYDKKAHRFSNLAFTIDT